MNETKNDTIRRAIKFPQPREQVWEALTDQAMLAEWMFPNDFLPRVGHQFTFKVPGNPTMKFDGLTVRCEVLECDAPNRLVFTWCVDGPVANTQVSYRLEADGEGTLLHFEHTGFDLTHPFANQAFRGAEYGWAKMHAALAELVAKS